MSLNSLSKKEIYRTKKSTLSRFYPTTEKEEYGFISSERSGISRFSELEQPEEVNRNILSVLVQYIPTESITLYVATLSAREALNSIFQISTSSIYWFFCLLTPILFFLIYLGDRKNSGLTLFPRLKKWPWWKLTACTIAFAAWALAIPGAPYLSNQGANGGVLAALIALFASTILSLLEPLFEA